VKVVQRFKWWLGLGLLLATLGLCGWQVWAWWNWAIAPPRMSISAAKESTEAGDAVQVKIPSGTAAQEIGRRLKAVGLIRSSLAWNFWARWLRSQDPEGGFKAGTYQLSPTQPLAAIADKIWRGQVMERSFTIPEGWSLRQMAAYFEGQGFFPARDFLTVASQIPRDRYPWLPPNLPFLEGFLYPDTYKLIGDRVTPHVVVEQMLNRFEQVALPLERQEKTKLSLLQWVTLASIVEKEAVVSEERPRIAGVFISRLRQGKRLETDPTVEYALGIRQTVDRPLTWSQVETPSPYNTYLNPGLPPTPIASPGLASLKAVLHPEKTDYLYFVARYDGTHVFSRTLSEHQAAQSAIRKKQEMKQKT
jgi:UPF0755 protein